MKVLAVGDMHLGRTPSRLPRELGERAQLLGPAESWRRSVDIALEAEVEAVLLGGDVVEREDDFFEAYRHLDRGVRRLAEAEVTVIGVAGNHDVKVLPRLAEQIPEFQLLGKGGTWQQHEITDGADVLTLWGWSFPQAKVHRSPLGDAPLARGKGINLGLLHCDRDAAASPYAPVAHSDLERAGLDGWLLGHIHKPDALSAPSPNGYLGSLVGLDCSETGPHGPWLITITGGKLTEVRHLPIAPLLWHHLEVKIDDIVEPDEAKGRLLQAVRALDNTQDHADAVGLRITFAGRSRFGSAAVEAIPRDDHSHLYTGEGGRHYFIESLRADTKPEIDLHLLAKRMDPPGLLARRLLLLEQQPGHADRDRLVEEARKRLHRQAARPRWASLDTSPPDPVEWLRRAAMRALDHLLAQAPDHA